MCELRPHPTPNACLTSGALWISPVVTGPQPLPSGISHPRECKTQQLQAAWPPPGAPTCWLSSQGRWWEAGGVGGGESGPAPSEETPQQPTFERFHQCGFPRSRVAKQLELDSWLEILRGSELLDEESSVCVLPEE